MPSGVDERSKKGSAQRLGVRTVEPTLSRKLKNQRPAPAKEWGTQFLVRDAKTGDVSPAEQSKGRFHGAALAFEFVKKNAGCSGRRLKESREKLIL
jgi:hypothetical protein